MPSINANNTRLQYHRYSNTNKPVLIVSHSLFFDHSMFEPLAAELSDVFDVISYDHRGQGQSDRIGPVDMDVLAEDAAALIKALDVSPCYFAGNSMGGFVALRLAARHPELLSGCIVMGSSADLEHKLAEFEPLVNSIAEQGTNTHIDTLMYIMFGDDSLRDANRAGLVARWREYMLALDNDIGLAALAVIHRKSMLSELHGLKVPLLVLAGEQDHAYSVADSEQIVSASGQGEMLVVSGAGHSVALEEPKQVAGYIRQFAGRIQAPSATQLIAVAQ
jgi:3-oxoadipate enol-lactonase